jgi:serine/threonine protein kinase
MKSHIIGNGSFGYIFYPCLKFKEKLDINNEEYITKLLCNEDAESELECVKLLNSIDITYKYHLGKYYKTTLQDDIYNNIINDYKLSLFKNLNVNDLTPIIMKKGGKNLNECAKIFKKYTINEINIIYLFLIEYYKLLEGIKLFNDNNVILYDIKPGNILYDFSTNKLIFIDFSLTNTKENIITTSRESDNELSIFYSSFPLESNYYNLNKFNNIKRKTNLEINIYCSKLESLINKKQKLHINNKFMKTLNELCDYYYKPKNINHKNDIIKNMLIKYKYTLLNLKSMGYDNFLDKSINTLDSYGYGVSLIFMLNHVDHIISNDLYIVLMDFAIKLSFIDLNNRLSIDEALVIFKNIIVKYISTI